MPSTVVYHSTERATSATLSCTWLNPVTGAVATVVSVWRMSSP